jgi:cysteine synthase A
MSWRHPQPEICGDLSAAIGNTPLLRLRKASEQTGSTILGKAEFMNPGGSGKDRVALYIVRDAERRGLLRPGGLVVTGASGEMRISLALVASARGYRVRLAKPTEQTDDPAHAAAQLAERLAATEPNGVLNVNPWDNRANRQSHYETTGPELWRQSGGRIDAFVCAVETGGTLAGAGAYLREQRRGVLLAVAEPTGEAPRVTGNLAGVHVDRTCAIPEDEARAVLRELLHEEGVCVGMSSALNVAAAVRVALALGAGHSVVTLLASSGRRD